jgi:predicted nucleic acid-binding protein
VRFWDTSALVPLLAAEPTSADIRAALRRDRDVVVWWATEVECVSALTKREHEGVISHGELIEAMTRLDGLAAGWQEVQPAASVRRAAVRVLRVHPLRAADAFQLAAALSVVEEHPETVPFVTLDGRLAKAAAREGFRVELPGLRDRRRR